MVKRALTLLTSILFALPLLMPFNIYADTLPQSEIVGVTYNKIDQDVEYLNSTGTYTYVYEIEVLLKNKYIGVVDGTLSYSYSELPQGQTVTVSKRTYVNGNSFKLNISIVQSSAVFTGGAPMYSASFLVNNQNTNVTKYEDLTSIESAVSILEDIYTNSADIENLSTNQLAELEKIVSNTSLANQYLDTISKLRQWNVPIESFGFNSFMISRYADFINNYKIYHYFQFPVYLMPSGSNVLYQTYMNANNSFDLIFIDDIATNSVAALQRNYTLYNFEVDSVSTIKVADNTYIVHAVCHSLNSDLIKISTNKTYSYTFIPIYYGLTSNKNISTEFALEFGLSNQLLDDIHIIANGTAQSSSAASSSDLANEQLQTDSNTLFTQEDNFKSDMNNAMQNVNSSFRLQDMGMKFVSSAQWVRTQYENLTNNTPFASLITFSLITGLALILLGKVYK